MSIKPEYSHKIVSGEKKYEFRKKAAAKNIDEIIIYSSSPEKKVVGTVEVKNVMIDTPENIWKKTFRYAGIDYCKYCEYFKNNKTAYAYVLGRVNLFETSKTLADFGLKYAPQSYQYLD